jgi:hypothetical protein
MQKAGAKDHTGQHLADDGGLVETPEDLSEEPRHDDEDKQIGQ